MTLSASYWAADRSQPVLGLTVGDALRDAAAEAPDTIALVEGAVDPAARRRWSYAELLEASERAARALLGRFTPGDRVAVWANNIPEWVILELAAGLAGITIVTVNPALRPQELAYVLGQSQADGIFLVPEYRASPMAEMVQQVRGDLPALREVVSFADWEAFCAQAAPDRALPAVSPDAPAQIQYTSGTTGFPKGAVLHHRGIVNNARLYTARLGLGRGNVYLSAMPLFHTAGCVMSVLGAVVTRGTLILPPYFDPGLMLELIAAERPQTLLGVPTMLIGMLDHPGFATTDLSSIRQLLTGGAVVPPALVGRVEAAFGAPLSIVFAQTEASPVITQTSPQDSAEDRAHTLGRPLPQTEVKITDPASGQTVAPGVIGELCTRGYHVMTGYFRDPEKTAAAIDADGWLHTGDLASMDERGYCQHRRAAQGHDHPRRREHLPARDRAGPVRAPHRGRRRRSRGARRDMGRAGRRIRAPRTRPEARPRRAVRLLPGAPRPAQDAALLDRGGGVPAYAVGQDPEIRAAGAFPRPGA